MVITERDLSGVAAVDDAVAEYLRQESAQTFDLMEGPLIRLPS